MKKFLFHLISILILVALILSVNHGAILAEEEYEQLEKEKQQLGQELEEKEGEAESSKSKKPS